MQNPLTIYDPTGGDRFSARAWRTMFAELWECRELIHRLVARNISGQFRQSFLGYVWVALPPIALTIIFSLLREARIVNVPMAADAMPYALFALTGTTIWSSFTQTVSMATTSISNAGTLVSKIYFPREALVLSAVGNSMVNILVRLVVLILAFVLFGYLPAWQAIFIPLLFIPLFALALGLGFLLAPLNTMMNDTSKMLEFLFQFGMFLAPTIYPTPILAEATTDWQTGLYWLHNLNPVSHIMYAVHGLIEHGTLAGTLGLSVSVMLSFLVLALGWRFFHICEPFLAERL